MKIGLILVCLALPTLSAAQEANPVLPGDKSLNTKSLRAGSWSMTWSGSRGTMTMPPVKLDYELKQTSLGGKDVWLFVQVVNSPRGKGVDSTWVTLDLQPIAHRGTAPQRTLKLDFAGTVVHGEYKPINGDAKAIHFEEKHPIFDSSVLDLIIGALPLRDGYKARIPVYIYEQGGTSWQEVSVKDAAANWEVQVLNNGTVITYQVSKSTREILSGSMNNNDIKVVLTRG